MRSPFFLLIFIAFRLLSEEPEFPLTEDSKPHPEVSQGELIKDTYTAKDSSVFPGTQREYQLYLPAGFDRTKPAPFMVFQDGVIYRAPVVFDNLIAKKELPALVGIFIKPGVVPAANDNALPRFNRSYEYDSITDTYAKFLIDELLPAIEQKHGIKLSSNPNDAAISGNSSGGIAAFMVAWHRSDRFRRVFTGVGTYVGIHGADQLPVLIRKMEPKPLKVFLQSGTGDNNLYCGDWWMANQMMERSLTWAGYEVNHAWGEGGHNQKHASQIFPDVLRWLWKGWPAAKEVKANPKGESKWLGYGVVKEREGWTSYHASREGPYFTVTKEGAVSQTHTNNSRSVLFGNESPVPLPEGRKFEHSQTALSPDQSQLYVTDPFGPYINCFTVGTKAKLLHEQKFYRLDSLESEDQGANAICVDTEGRLYVATPLGIQVCDQAGRVNFIIPTPQQPYDVCFGGKDLSELFISCGYKIYKRPMKVRGIVSGQMPPIKPAPPKL